MIACEGWWLLHCGWLGVVTLGLIGAACVVGALASRRSGR